RAPAPSRSRAPTKPAAPHTVAFPGVTRAALRQPISLEAQSSQIDYRTHQLVFDQVTIRQGSMSISAALAHATGLDFDDSHWAFRGDVHIVVNRGDLRSSAADITFARQRLASATVTGAPARFTQVDPKSGRLVQGHAQKIDYEVAKGIVTLSKDAWLTDGHNEINGQILKYDIAARSVIATSADQNSHRVRITITPPAKPEP
ncbi:MAG: lipopolysaccharide transport periplasmic protein LptA, partial [Gammaproteobacteria bacterium]|nr:lipopolysaccharide transport periplasmic protein LptA [Gammaproteobacteria bacterium]